MELTGLLTERVHAKLSTAIHGYIRVDCRAGYVLCDPVLACLGVTPGLLLKELPLVVNEHDCLAQDSAWNATYTCLQVRIRNANCDI